MKSAFQIFLLIGTICAIPNLAFSEGSFADGQEVEPTETIFGGSSVTTKDPLSLVIVQVEENLGSGAGDFKNVDEASCSGTLIAADVVLTAAHCFNQFDASKQTLSVKYRALNGSLKITTMKDHVVYPSYQKSEHASANDLALIRLNDSINDRSPVLLAGPSDLTPSTQLIVAGFGDSSGEQIDLMTELTHDPQLLKLEEQLKAVPNTPAGGIQKTKLTGEVATRLNQIWDSSLTLHRTSMTGKVVNTPAPMLEVEDAASTICQGDSGGPSLIQENGKYSLVGVHSGGNNDSCTAPTGGFFGFGASNYIGIDVYVPGYTSWIKTQVASWRQQADI